MMQAIACSALAWALLGLDPGPKPAPAPAPEAAGSIRYNRDVRPILAENCFRCHGPDSAARQAELRLDRRDDAIKAGAIAPGNPDESELLFRVESKDPNEVMPPPATHKVVTPQQQELLRRWIVAGAEYEPHWSFLPPARPAMPALKNPGWVRNPIDALILAKIEEAGLTPAPEADRRTLARRAALDLTGLPPDAADVELFVNDPAPDAYERYLDRLLASPRWGEHRGRHWLDYARYADTHGIHFDNYREMWTYRDWVINAFNQNMPFDRFVTEQLAGDLLPTPTIEQQVATGFNRCNITTNEGGVIAEEYLVLYTRDRTETASQVFLGLTTGCAVCHDHKFDPVSQREFYELAAFFNNSTQGAMDGNIKDTPPILMVPNEVDRPRAQALPAELAAANQAVEARKAAGRPEFDAWLGTSPTSAVALPTEGLALHLPLGEEVAAGAPIKLTRDGQAVEVPAPEGTSFGDGHVATKAYQVKAGAKPLTLPEPGDFEKDQAFTVAAWVRLDQGAGNGALVARMDDSSGYRGWDVWVEGNQVGMHVISHWQDNAIKAIGTGPLPANQWAHVVVRYDGSGKAEGIQTYVDGQPKPMAISVNSLSASVKTAVPLSIGQRHQQSRLNGATVQDVRIYSRALPPAEVLTLATAGRAAWLVAKPAANRIPAELDELYGWWQAQIDPIGKETRAKVAALQAEEAALKARSQIAHVSAEKAEPAMAFILNRGEYDKRKDQVAADTPDFLPPYPADTPKNRLGLARWMLTPEHPLTTRVTANRIWQEVFGEGIVRTTGDFGIAGELPNNQELLDWLAVELRESGWDLKRYYKLLLTSATYRQAAIATPEKLEKDPQNRLLSRGPRFRMDAEMIRDGALAVSGLLSSKIGGPSVKPYQPDGVWEAVAMIGSNTRDYKRDSGDSLYRRSMYTFWKRSAPPASMDVFNAPAREVCSVRRERTNTPLQALNTLNDIQHVEAARKLAESTLTAAPTWEARVAVIARKLLARPFTPEELAIVKGSLDALSAHYAANPGDADKLVLVGESVANPNLPRPELAAWTMLANELMNLDEVVTK